MYCTNCGQQNDDTAVFCTHCGAPMAVPAAPSAAQQEYVSQAYPTPVAGYPGKKRTGLIIGLSIGGVVVIAAVVWIVLLLTSGSFVKGVWFNEKHTEALEFEDDNDVTIYTVMGEIDGGYEYDRQDGEGEIWTDEKDYDFFVGKDMLIVNDERIYIRAADDFDIDDFIDEAVPEATDEP